MNTGTLFVVYFSCGERIYWREQPGVKADEIMRELVRIGSRKGLRTPDRKSFDTVECHWRADHPTATFHRQWSLTVD